MIRRARVRFCNSIIIVPTSHVHTHTHSQLSSYSREDVSRYRKQMYFYIAILTGLPSFCMTHIFMRTQGGRTQVTQMTIMLVSITRRRPWEWMDEWMDGQKKRELLSRFSSSPLCLLHLCIISAHSQLISSLLHHHHHHHHHHLARLTSSQLLLLVFSSLCNVRDEVKMRKEKEEAEIDECRDDVHLDAAGAI